MIRKSVKVHSSLLFDPKKKEFVKNVSLRVDLQTGTIVDVYERTSDDEIGEGDIDLRGKTVMPGLVDAHTHIFLHPYRFVRFVLIVYIIMTCEKLRLGGDISQKLII